MSCARWSLRLPRQALRSYTTARRPNSSSRFRSDRINRPPSLPPQRRDGLNKKSTPSGNTRDSSSEHDVSFSTLREHQAQSSTPQQSSERHDASSLPPSSSNGPISRALQEADIAGTNPLQTPVHIPEDPHGIIKENHPATAILANSTVVVQRELEMMNIIIGFEQANKYVILDPHGNHIGYLAEQQHGVGSALARQSFKTHRSFTTHVFDREQKEVLRFHRPFSWISSKIRVYDAVNPDPNAVHLASDAISNISPTQGSAQISSLPLTSMRVIGEAQQKWAPLRRKYNLFLHRDFDALERDANAPQLTSGELPLSDSKALQRIEGDSRNLGMSQFAFVDERWLSWDFSLLSADEKLLGSVNRNFRGFAREIFTDTGAYALRMDSAALEAEPGHWISQSGKTALDDRPAMSLDQRAVMLATAVSIDFDYFSRQSSHFGGLPLPIWIPGMGGGATEAGAAGAGAAGAGEAGAITEAGAGGVAGAAGRSTGIGAAESGIAGAGTMAGYEAMQRGRGGQDVDDASPQAQYDPYLDQPPTQGGQQQEDVWGESWNWDDTSNRANSSGSSGDSPSSGTDGGASGGDGEGFDITDWF